MCFEVLLVKGFRIRVLDNHFSDCGSSFHPFPPVWLALYFNFPCGNRNIFRAIYYQMFPFFFELFCNTVQIFLFYKCIFAQRIENATILSINNLSFQQFYTLQYYTEKHRDPYAHQKYLLPSMLIISLQCMQLYYYTCNNKGL